MMDTTRAQPRNVKRPLENKASPRRKARAGLDRLALGVAVVITVRLCAVYRSRRVSLKIIEALRDDLSVLRSVSRSPDRVPVSTFAQN